MDLETILQVMTAVYTGKTIAYYASFGGWSNMPRYAKTVLALPTPLDAMYAVCVNHRREMQKLQQKREEFLRQRRERLKKEDSTNYDK